MKHTKEWKDVDDYQSKRDRVELSGGLITYVDFVNRQFEYVDNWANKDMVSR